MTSLTARLLQADASALRNATTHEFLEAAATSTLDPEHLKHWLAQDRLYAIAYVNFVGSLLARVSLPTSTNCFRTKEGSIVDLLIDCLDNIRRELHLFEQMADDEGWTEAMHDAQPTIQTRAYQDVFAGATSPSQPLIVGLTVLWATEECYLRAWTRVRKMGQSCSRDVVQKILIPNWSSDHFTAFVARIETLLNDYESSMDGCNRFWPECRMAFRQVVWAEAQFWPKVE